MIITLMIYCDSYSYVVIRTAYASVVIPSTVKCLMSAYYIVNSIGINKLSLYEL